MRLILLWIAAASAGIAAAGPALAGADLATLPDPTRPAAAGASEDVRPRGLTAIRITAHGRSAVIDGKVVSVGDAIHGGVVQDIRPDEVLVRTGDRVSTLRLVPDLKRNAPQRNNGK